MAAIGSTIRDALEANPNAEVTNVNLFIVSYKL